MFAKAGRDPDSAASRGGGGAGEKDSGSREGEAHGGADGVHGEREDDGRAREARGAALCEQRTQSGSFFEHKRSSAHRVSLLSWCFSGWS